MSLFLIIELHEMVLSLAYDFVEDKHRGAQNPVEGLMYSDIDNIHAILLTREKTLPNISALMNTLMETDAIDIEICPISN